MLPALMPCALISDEHSCMSAKSCVFGVRLVIQLRCEWCAAGTQWEEKAQKVNRDNGSLMELPRAPPGSGQEVYPSVASCSATAFTPPRASSPPAPRVLKRRVCRNIRHKHHYSKIKGLT